MVKKELDETEGDELKGFVRYVADLMPLQEAPQS
jgi:triacylglycerol esterase/lipase EstA (alpha/beta hydrolase family)